MTNKEYQEINKISRETSKRELNELVKKKIFAKVDRGRSTHYILS